MTPRRRRHLAWSALAIVCAIGLGAVLGWQSRPEPERPRATDSNASRADAAAGVDAPRRTSAPDAAGTAASGSGTSDTRASGAATGPDDASPRAGSTPPSRGLTLDLSGRVLDQLGQPVRGCGLLLQPLQPSGWLRDRAPSSEDLATDEVMARTDARGAFRCRLDEPDASTRFALFLDHPQFPPQVATAGLRPTRQPRDLGDLVLHSTVGLQITLRSREDGRPLPAAQIDVRPQLLDPLLSRGAAHLARAARTDRDGVARLYGLPDGPLRLQVGAEGHATQQLDLPATPAARPTRLQLFLEPGHSLSGILLDGLETTREPLVGALIRAVSDSSPAIVAVDRTDARGHFRLAGLPLGRCRLEVESLDRPIHRIHGVDLPSERALRISVPRGIRVAGRVRSADEAPLPGCRVAVEFPDGRPIRDGRLAAPTATTDRRGHFTIGGLPPGRIRIRVTSQRHMELSTQPRLLEAATAEDAVAWLGDLTLAPGAVLSGRVLSASDGQPIAGAAIRIARGAPPTDSWSSLLRIATPTGAASTEAQSDAEGRFRTATPLAPGEAGHLLVRAAGHAPLMVSVDGADVGDLSLLPAIELRGVVTDEAGNPVRGARVRATPVGAGPSGRMATTAAASAADGSFRLFELAPGPYALQAVLPRGPGRSSASRSERLQVEVKLAAGTQQFVELALASPALSGRSTTERPATRGPDPSRPENRRR